MLKINAPDIYHHNLSKSLPIFKNYELHNLQNVSFYPRPYIMFQLNPFQIDSQKVKNKHNANIHRKADLWEAFFCP